ncbi:MAG: DUF3015 family protein [Pseudomonadales bacterium]|nr:DUF3015 family protein [Pseudomonadales bacterium]
MKLSNVVFVLLMMIGSSHALAAGEAGSGPNPYSDCGIGAALFKHDVAATISNVIWDLGTTAVISATASPETCSGKEATTARLIYEAYPNFEDETAKGEGEHLVAMLNVLACSQDAHDAIISGIRQDFGNVLLQEGYTTKSRLEKSEAYYHIVMEQASTHACSG